MSQLIKNFNDFINEGQGPAHDWFRKYHAAARTGVSRENPDSVWMDRAAGDQLKADLQAMKKNEPAEFDRTLALADRTHLARKKDKSRVHYLKQYIWAIQKYVYDISEYSATHSERDELEAEMDKVINLIGSARKLSDIEPIVVDFFNLDTNDTAVVDLLNAVGQQLLASRRKEAGNTQPGAEKTFSGRSYTTYPDPLFDK